MMIMEELWFAQLTNDATLYGDGRKTNFNSFFENAIENEKFTGIDEINQRWGLSMPILGFT